MTDTIGKLGLSVLGVSVLLGGLWAAGRGQAAAGETDGLVGQDERVAAAAASANLVGLEDPVSPLLEEVLEPQEEDRVAIESGDVVEFACVHGVVSLPGGFEPTEPVEVFAWPVGEGERAPVRLELGPSTREWTFQELSLGRWVFTARAVAKDHCAWGKSRELFVLAPDRYDGVEVPLKEFGVRGLLTDKAGSPVPGVAVNYDLDYSDMTVGSIEDWARRRQPVELELSSNRVHLSFVGGELELVAESLLIPSAESDFLVTSIEELIPPPADPFPAQPVTAGGAFTSTAQVDSALEAALLEMAVRGLEDETVGSPSLDGPRIIRSTSSAWGFEPSNFVDVTEVAEDVPSIPSSGTVLTDAAGRFWIALPGPGEVSMQVASTRIEYGETDPGYLGDSTSVDLTPDAPIGEARLALERAAALVGRLVRGDGHLDDLSVFLRPAEGGNTATGSTDAEGRFRFSARKPGRYIFYARSGGNSGQEYCTTAEIDLVAGSVYSLDDVLTGSSSLTGVVVGADGQPVTGANVTAYGANNRSLKRTGVTDEWGSFTIRGMYPVEYILEVSGKPAAQGAKFLVPPAGGMANAGTLTLDGAESPPR